LALDVIAALFSRYVPFIEVSALAQEGKGSQTRNDKKTAIKGTTRDKR
jgi:hypothetical protein